MEFQSVAELRAYLEEDSKKRTINPVRLINVESISVWVQVKSMLNGLSQQHLKVSTFCEDEDTAPNLIAFKSAVRNLTKSTLITPISEYLRIHHSVAEKTYAELLHTNFHNTDYKLRIYIPVYRMREVLNAISPKDPRLNDCMLFLNTLREDDYSLTIIQKELKVDIDGHTINGFKKYLEYWEENPNKPIILHTKNAIHYNEAKFVDDVRVIVTSYDLLRCHYGFPIDIDSRLGTEEQWHYLAAEYKNTKEFDSTMCRLFAVNKYDSSLFSKWTSYDIYHQWMLWLWSKYTFCDKSSYLYKILTYSDNVENFISALFCDIMDYKNSNLWERYYRDRYALIKQMNILPSSKFWTKLETVEGLDKIKCLTNLSDKEKEEIILSLQDIDLCSSTDVLAICYPELAHYLSPFNVDSSIDEYFNNYRYAKVSNKTSNKFIQEVYSIAEEQGKRVYIFGARTQVVNELYDNNAIILFVDSLGAEYIPLLEHLFDVKTQITYCNLPSITGLNNDFLIGKKTYLFYELDKWKHANHVYPSSIRNELDLVMGLTDIVQSLLIEHERVIIAADHGSSRLAVLHKGNSLPTKEGYIKKYRFGRYCEDSQNEYSEYSGCWLRDNNWIFANYDRFSQQGAPTNEIHGGATLEEMLVPVLVINRNKEANVVIEESTQQINIMLLSKEPRMTLNKTVKIEFKLDSILDNVIAVVNNVRYPCAYANGIYSFEHEVGLQSEYTATINCGRIIGEIKYKVKKGISNNFDI